MFAMFRAMLAATLVAVFVSAPLAVRAQVEVGRPSALRKLVPAGPLEGSASRQYDELTRQAAASRTLAPDDHPQVRRLRGIAKDIIPFAVRWNPRAGQWRWEVNLIGSKQINAFCMPGGKIVFYSGILDGLKLTDAEVAMVMGHEIAHALREHARERIAKSELTQLGASLLGEMIGGGKYAGAFQIGGDMLSLKFSRDDESEADVVGLELAARAGYDPRAAVTLWQKMAAASRGSPPQWLSTHPSGKNRIQKIERQLPQVLPLYAEARKR
ncbi:MAG: M48 family metallopeptidase [Gammaproteobacteria bacterium]|nr:M48 family metallopeptidase [Gammaproteobacteria bacterium]MBU1646196.1 M48 family metallopeptidase [Gammaproteobacteria bacterium]MBU1972258.1 M48 family metallopeptidase [Gammaproteobacteria bacterium]